MPKIDVIGVGLGPGDVTDAQRELIRAADILAGGKRMLAWFEDHPGQKFAITADLSGLVTFLKAHLNRRRIVVLASGDPLFFGIGRYLMTQLGAENIVFHPNVSSVAAGFSRLKIAHEDAVAVSLHGRADSDVLWRAMAGHEKVAVLTDHIKSPAWLAQQLKARKIADVEMWVLERLGHPREQVVRYALDDAAGRQFAQPNIVILIRSQVVAGPVESGPGQSELHLGLPDEAFQHQRGLITKAEVRAVTLAKLRLQPRHVFWDLGAGSGSVAVEAANFIYKGTIVAVEKDARRCRQIEANVRRFGLSQVSVVEARLPAGIDTLPVPDRVFIGGGGRDLAAIITIAAGYLKPAGIMVVNTVIIANAHGAYEALAKAGFKTAMVQVQISRGREMSGGPRLQAENPVFIITGEKQ